MPEFLINILPLVYFSLCVWVLWKKNPLARWNISGWMTISVFTLKVFAGTLLWFIYTYYYEERTTSDAFRFFDDARVMHQALLNDPVVYIKMLFGVDTQDPALQKYVVQMFNWDKEYNYFMYNDSRTMIRFNAVCMLFSFGNYHVHTIGMSLVSLLGGIYLFKAFVPFLAGLKKILFLAIHLVPSVLLHTSGVLKEGILMLGLGLFFYGLIFVFREKKRLPYLFFLAAGTFILLIMKIYVLLCLLPAVGYFISSHFVLKKRLFLWFLLSNAVVFLGLVFISVGWPDKDIFQMLWKKKDDFANVARIFDAHSYFNTPVLSPTAGGLLAYIPFALLTSFFRPFIWEASGALQIFSSLENMAVFACMIFSMLWAGKFTPDKKRLIFTLVCFVFYLFVLIGVTTPVMGALVRYKVPGLPFIFITCLLLLNTEKIKKLLGIK